MNIVLTSDIQRLLRMQVENGQFPSEEAVVEAALKRFLLKKPGREPPPVHSVSDVQKTREPGPFIDDESVSTPGDLPRSGQKVICRHLRDGTRQPDIFPGE